MTTTLLHGKLFFPFIAPPNGGKGTQTLALLKAFPDALTKIDMGGLLRAAAADPNNTLGEAIRTAQNAGQLVDISIVMGVLAEGLAAEAQKQPSVQGFLLDGFPRSVEQYTALKGLCAQHGTVMAKAYYLDVPADVIIARASGRVFDQTTHQPYNLNNPELYPPAYADAKAQAGFELSAYLAAHNLYQREDDKAETVQKRLDGFAKDTQPMVDAFEADGVLVTLNGTEAPEALTQVLITQVGAILDASKTPAAV